jgi:endoglycosylceramidase
MRYAALLAVSVLAALPAGAAGAAKPPFSHSGRWLTDADGRVFMSHGVNLVYKVPPYEATPSGFGRDDAEFLAREGFNSVRLGLIYKAVEPQPGVYDDNYLLRIASFAQLLDRHGIVPLLDFHQDLYNERFEGEGWPDWAVQDDGLRAEPKAGFPGNYVVMPALNRAFDHFWANDLGPGDVGLVDRYAAAWRHVAERFRDQPGHIGYDLLNEPWPGSQWPSCANNNGCPPGGFDQGAFTDFYRRVIAAIRTVDRDSLIWYEPNVLFNSGADTQLPDLGDDKLGFSWHDYCLVGSGTGGDTSDPVRGGGCGTLESLPFQNSEKHIAATGDTVMVTEFGATMDLAAIKRVVDGADKFMQSWQWWHYCPCNDPTTAGPGETQAIVNDPSKPPAGGNVQSPKMNVLVRPYPQLTAGTPSKWGFDEKTKSFEFTYSTERAGGGALPAEALTEVFVPERQYPDGYRVQAQGAAVVSRGRVLELAPCAGAKTVTLKVLTEGDEAVGCAAAVKGVRVPAIRLTVSPLRVRAGRTVRYRFRATAVVGGRRVGVAGARLRFRSRNLRTDRLGRATVRRRIAKPGRYRAHVWKRSFRRGAALVRVVP